MRHIDSGDYTAYGQESAGIPWPDTADQRIMGLERESQEHTEEITNTNFNQKALLMRVESLERQVHRLLNPGEVEEAE